MKNYAITRKVNHYRKQLALLYKETKEPILENIISTSLIYVNEEVHYDNWNGGTTSHDLIFYLDEEVYGSIGGLEKIPKIVQRIRDDFNTVSSSVPDELISAVHIELFNSEDTECQNAIQPDDVISIHTGYSKFWRPDHLKLFVSHKSEHKKLVNELSDSLLPYGISCFVAHEDIEPTTEWRNEIEKALRSMDVFLAFLTDNFSDGDWTNQEVGFAIARGVPIIPLKISSKNPCGFMSIYQALQGQVDNPKRLAKGIFNLISRKFDKKNLVRKAAIAAFINSTSFFDADEAFKRLQAFKDFTDIELENLVNGFNSNNQLYECYLINGKSQFFNFIKSNSTKKYEMEGSKINLVNDEEVPF